MAISAVLVRSTGTTLRYRITAGAGAGEAVTITSTGAASPDLITDAQAGLLKQLATVNANGYGTVVAGSVSTAQARSLFLSDGAVGKPTAICRVHGRSVGDMVVDAAAAANSPTITVTAPTAGTAYLDISVPGVLGL